MTETTSKYAVPEGETEEEHKVRKKRGRKRGGVTVEGEGDGGRSLTGARRELFWSRGV